MCTEQHKLILWFFHPFTKDCRLLDKQIQCRANTRSFWDIGTAHAGVLFLTDTALLKPIPDPLICELHGRVEIVKGLISVIC